MFKPQVFVLAISLASVIADESADHAAAYQHYYQTNDLQGYTGENVVQNSLAQFGDRQDLQDPLVVSGAIGIGNLVATGLAWANNRDEIDSLRTRVEKLESLLKSTCNKVNDVTTAADFIGTESTNIAANTADGDTAQGAVLTRLAAVSETTTAADFTGTESTDIAANSAAGNTAQGAVLTRLAAITNIDSCTL